jgi:hypothetical protein
MRTARMMVLLESEVLDCSPDEAPGPDQDVSVMVTKWSCQVSCNSQFYFQLVV